MALVKKNPKRIDADDALSFLACIVVILAVFHFWIWPLIKSLVWEG